MSSLLPMDVKCDVFMNYFKTDPSAVYTRVCHTAPIMEEYLLFVPSNVTNVEGVYYFTFTSPNIDIIFESCD